MLVADSISRVAAAKTWNMAPCTDPPPLMNWGEGLARDRPKGQGSKLPLQDRQVTMPRRDVTARPVSIPGRLGSKPAGSGVKGIEKVPRCGGSESSEEGR